MLMAHASHAHAWQAKYYARSYAYAHEASADQTTQNESGGLQPSVPTKQLLHLPRTACEYTTVCLNKLLLASPQVL
jgi:hypothetical protein